MDRARPVVTKPRFRAGCLPSSRVVTWRGFQFESFGISRFRAPPECSGDGQRSSKCMCMCMCTSADFECTLGCGGRVLVCKGCFRLHFALLVGYPLCLENLFRTRDDEGALVLVRHARVDRVHFATRLCPRLAVRGLRVGTHCFGCDPVSCVARPVPTKPSFGFSPCAPRGSLPWAIGKGMVRGTGSTGDPGLFSF